MEDIIAHLKLHLETNPKVTKSADYKILLGCKFPATFRLRVFFKHWVLLGLFRACSLARHGPMDGPSSRKHVAVALEFVFVMLFWWMGAFTWNIMKFYGLER